MFRSAVLKLSAQDDLLLGVQTCTLGLEQEKYYDFCSHTLVGVLCLLVWPKAASIHAVLSITSTDG